MDVPRWFRGLMPVVIIPLFASLIVGLLMFMLLGRPLAALTTGLTDWLSGMSGTSAVLLGVILGLMMCFDLGGPVNKAAYAFATAGLTAATTASFEIMAHGDGRRHGAAAGDGARDVRSAPAVQRAGAGERQGRWLLGACFISEGAIPFAAADPFRVIPSMMFGGAITGALCMAFGVTLAGAARRHLRVLRHRPSALVHRRHPDRHGGGALAVIAAKQFAKPSVKVDETPALATA